MHGVVLISCSTVRNASLVATINYTPKGLVDMHLLYVQTKKNGHEARRLYHEVFPNLAFHSIRPSLAWIEECVIPTLSLHC